MGGVGYFRAILVAIPGVVSLEVGDLLLFILCFIIFATGDLLKEEALS